MAPRHLLVVTADPSFEQLLQENAPRGSRVDVAGTGREAIVRFRADPPDLVVVDDPVSDMEGCDVVERLGASYADAKICFVTSRHSPALEQRVRCQGILFYTSKPVDPQSLRRVLACGSGGHASARRTRAAAGGRS